MKMPRCLRNESYRNFTFSKNNSDAIYVRWIVAKNAQPYQCFIVISRFLEISISVKSLLNKAKLQNLQIEKINNYLNIPKSFQNLIIVCFQ